MADEEGPHPEAAAPPDHPAATVEPTAAEFEGLGGETNPEILPSREPWRSIVHAIGMIEQVVGTLLLAAVLVLVLTLVAQRYLPGANFPWTGEVARLSMVWATFVMAGYLAAHDRHIAIHVVDYVLPDRAVAGVKLLVNVVVLAACLALALATYQLIADDIGQVTPAAQLPLKFVNAVPIIGFALTALRAVLWILVSDIPTLMGRHEGTA
jgi:TRAP-type C4-dicarboxylate transport system permease small subunit